MNGIRKRKRSWKTTGLGVATIGLAVMKVLAGTADETDMALITAGIGLLFGRDGKVIREEED